MACGTKPGQPPFKGGPGHDAVLNGKEAQQQCVDLDGLTERGLAKGESIDFGTKRLPINPIA
jgi:hypothetical protein